jgi:hypothetical protein
VVRGRADLFAEPCLNAAVLQEISHFDLHKFSFGQAEGCYSQELYGNPAYRPATEKAPATGPFLWTRFAVDSSCSARMNGRI